MTPRDIARDLLTLAEVLDRRGFLMSGICRQAARVLAALPTPDERACPTCGCAVTQRARGRPRVYCTDRCRRRKYGRNATVDA